MRRRRSPECVLPYPGGKSAFRSTSGDTRAANLPAGRLCTSQWIEFTYPRTSSTRSTTISRKLNGLSSTREWSGCSRWSPGARDVRPAATERIWSISMSAANQRFPSKWCEFPRREWPSNSAKLYYARNAIVEKGNYQASIIRLRKIFLSRNYLVYQRKDWLFLISENLLRGFAY